MVGARKLSDEEKERLHEEVIEWIEENDAHFKRNCEKLYDEKNLDRIKRFASAPKDYIDERIELNKEVSRNYHKMHTTILLAGFTGFYAVLLSSSITVPANTTEITLNTHLHIVIVAILVAGALLAPRIRLTYRLMKMVGLLKVILDSEIEIYYLSKIKEHREKVKKA